MQSTRQPAFFTQARAQVADSSSQLPYPSDRFFSSELFKVFVQFYAPCLPFDPYIRKRSGARYGCFYLGSGFRTASIAAVGSSSTPKRPMPRMSWEPTGILAPSFLARAIVASTSSTAT